MPDIIRILFSFSGKVRILHLTWVAFFISFFLWFNHAPLMMSIKDSVHLTESEVNVILLLNVALTIPARIIIGIVVDRYGAKISYSLLLAISSIPCFMFAAAQSFEQLAWARFFLSFIGAGFVIGIRIIGDWFPAQQIGIAEGIYGGWGNFGSAAGVLILPGLALYLGADDGWRYAIALTGLLALGYSIIYYRSVENAPPFSRYLKPKRYAALEVTSIQDLFLYIVTTIPLYVSMSLLTWKLSTPDTQLLSGYGLATILILIWAVFFGHAYKIVAVNADHLSRPIASIHHYQFKQISLMSIAYLMTFGSKLAVVSMLPFFFFNTFHDTQNITLVDAGLLASGFIIMNLVARPAGGWLSDQSGRKKWLTFFMLGMALGYFLMSFISENWSLYLTLVVTVICSIFVQAAEGAVFAIVPLIKRNMTGQIAGIVGAYGNAGAIFFLTLFTFVTPGEFFTFLAMCSLISLALVCFLEEPKEYITEIMADGSSVKIELT